MNPLVRELLRPVAQVHALLLLPLYDYVDLVREEVGNLAVQRIKDGRR